MIQELWAWTCARPYPGPLAGPGLSGPHTAWVTSSSLLPGQEGVAAIPTEASGDTAGKGRAFDSKTPTRKELVELRPQDSPLRLLIRTHPQCHVWQEGTTNSGAALQAAPLP